MKKILSLILATVCGITTYAADANWKIHHTFDEEVNHVVETPDYVYFTSRRMVENNKTQTYFSLFRYDKKGEEMVTLSPQNILHANSVSDVIYNPTKGYLAVVYNNYDIDFLHNNGKVTHLPYYMMAGISNVKDINSMTVDKTNDRLYLATEFGYVAINDKKNEVAESRIYGVPFKAFARLGNTYLVIKDNDILAADASSPRFNFDDYTKLASFSAPAYLYPLDGTRALLVGGDVNNRYVKKISLGNNGSSLKEDESLAVGKILNIENNSKGVTVATNNNIYQFNNDGTHSMVTAPENLRGASASTNNGTEWWFGKMRQGIASAKKSGESWNLTHNWMRPNAPATFASTSYINHPSFGFLMLDYGCTPVTYNLYSNSPMQLSGYKDGRWTNYGLPYTNPDRMRALTAPTGMAMDPDNNNYIYITSYHNGIMRINLADPKNIIHIGAPWDADKGNPGFAELSPAPITNKDYNNIAAPYFDSKGNLWMAAANYDDTDPHPNYYVWLAEDRKASTPSNVRTPKYVTFSGYFPTSNTLLSIPLNRTGNGNLHLYATSDSKPYLGIINTNGTPTTTTDDRVYSFPSFVDSDGTEVEMARIKYMWEDPNTGYVWLCTRKGLSYFVPSQAIAGDYHLERPKVSRNDGTNLADYLLDGVEVNQMTVDADGRKWFATHGGVVCTSPDGRMIYQEFNSSNSPLPDDIVYGVAYNSVSNSLMFSTDQGYAEYFLPSTQNTDDKAKVKAYPNPVRPEYSGYVTITDIPQGSFVKITDIHGNLVKDLGVMSGFEMLWDLSDSNFNRVKSGVYHIMISPANESSNYSGVGKILVIS